MKRYSYYIILLLLFSGRVAGQKVEEMKCEQQWFPSEGIDVSNPRLSWRITGEGQDLRETAWQVIVASSRANLEKNKGDLWNSGKVAGDQSWMVPYAGVPLKSRMLCYWKVRVWTNRGDSIWSDYEWWTMGLLKPSDWKAKWIGYDQPFPWDSVSKFSRLSARYFRKRFFCPDGIRNATLYIVGLGHYVVSLHGGYPIGEQ